MCRDREMYPGLGLVKVFISFTPLPKRVEEQLRLYQFQNYCIRFSSSKKKVAQIFMKL